MLQIRSVEIAMKYGVPVHGRTSFTEEPGTWVVGEEETMEASCRRGTHSTDEARVTLLGVPDHPGVVAGSSARSPTRTSPST